MMLEPEGKLKRSIKAAKKEAAEEDGSSSEDSVYETVPFVHPVSSVYHQLYQVLCKDLKSQKAGFIPNTIRWQSYHIEGWPEGVGFAQGLWSVNDRLALLAAVSEDKISFQPIDKKKRHRSRVSPEPIEESDEEAAKTAKIDSEVRSTDEILVPEALSNGHSDRRSSLYKRIKEVYSADARRAGVEPLKRVDWRYMKKFDKFKAKYGILYANWNSKDINEITALLDSNAISFKFSEKTKPETSNPLKLQPSKKASMSLQSSPILKSDDAKLQVTEPQSSVLNALESHSPMHDSLKSQLVLLNTIESQLALLNTFESQSTEPQVIKSQGPMLDAFESQSTKAMEASSNETQSLFEQVQNKFLLLKVLVSESMKLPEGLRMEQKLFTLNRLLEAFEQDFSSKSKNQSKILLKRKIVKLRSQLAEFVPNL